MGVWQRHDEVPGGGFICSNCGYFIWQEPTPYCSWCGDKMKINPEDDPLIASLEIFKENQKVLANGSRESTNA